MVFRGKKPRIAATLLCLLATGAAVGSAAENPKDRISAVESLVSEGRYGDASARARELLAEVESEFGADSIDAASVLHVLVDALWRGGRFDAEVGEMAERALAIRERMLEPDHPDIASSLNTLGNFRLMTGDFPGARSCYERSLDIRRKILPPDHPDIGAGYSNLALAFFNLGEYSASRRNYDRALAIRERTLGPDHPKVASTLLKLGMLLLTEGDLDRARSHYLRALEILEKHHGPRHPDALGARQSLAGLYTRIGEYRKALALLETNVELCIAVLGPDHPDTASNLNYLGNVLWELGRRREAADSFRRALRISEKVYGPQHPQVALLLSNHAAVLAESDKHDQALPLYLRALEIQRGIVGSEHPDVAVTLLKIARVHLLRGDAPASLKNVLEAELILRQAVLSTVGSMTEQEAIRFKGTLDDALSNAMAVLASLKPEAARGATAKVWDRVVRSRSMVMDEIAARRKTSTGRREDRRRIGLQEVTRALPEDSSLVSYFKFYQIVFPGHPDYPVNGSGNGDDSAGTGPRLLSYYMALVFRQGDTLPRVVPLGRGLPIATQVREWRQQLRPPVLPLAARQVEAQSRVVGSELRKAIWDPVAPFVEDSKMVFLVPDGVIHLVSFGALPTGSEKYLVESGPLLHYVAAERDLVRSARPEAGSKGILAVGGPDFNLGPEPAGGDPSGSSCDPLGSLEFKSLPAAVLEAREIASLWESSTGPGRGTAHILTGAEAGETEFRRLAPGKRVLHLATHAFREPDACPPTEVPGGIGGRSGSGIESDPLPIAGLALAGANRRLDAGRADDGILTSDEIAALDLDGVEWAVLSACETGVGEVTTGEGVLGLRRAFENAGVGTLILSLWYLDDQATRIWMRHLYRHRIEGKSTAQAMRAASLDRIDELRRKRRSTHPFYWGSFVATGDWR